MNLPVNEIPEPRLAPATFATAGDLEVGRCRSFVACHLVVTVIGVQADFLSKVGHQPKVPIHQRAIYIYICFFKRGMPLVVIHAALPEDAFYKSATAVFTFVGQPTENRLQRRSVKVCNHLLPSPGHRRLSNENVRFWDGLGSVHWQGHLYGFVVTEFERGHPNSLATIAKPLQRCIMPAHRVVELRSQFEKVVD